MAFRLLVDDARRWKNSIDAIVNLIDEGQLEINAEGLLLRAMDPSQIAMVAFSMPKSAFLEYEVSGSSKIGLNFDNLSKILARTRGKEQLEISDEDNKLVLRFLEGKRKRSFKVPLMDLPPGVQKEPSIKHDVQISVGANQFKETLRDAALVSSHLTLEANEDGFKIEVHGDSADLKVESEKTSEEIISLKATAPARATFPLQYLEDITKACPDDKPIHINLKSNAPVKIEYEVESAKCVYYLAPRIDTE
jgi:proliferating cell nuclear antigen